MLSSPQRPPTGNRLLDSLPAADRRRMLTGFEMVDLAFAEVLYTPGERLSHVYFPTESFISLIMPVDTSSSLEVGLVGSEGMFGIPLASASTSRPCVPWFKAAEPRCAWTPRASGAS